MTPDDPPVRRAHRPRSVDVLPLPLGEDLCPHDPHEHRHEHDRDRDHRLGEARPEHGRDGEREDELRKRKHRVGEPHQDIVQPAAVESRDDPQGQPGGDGEADRDDPGLERRPGPEDDAAQDVPAQFVRAHRVARTGGLQVGGKVGLDRRRRRDPRREQGREEDQDEQDEPPEREAVVGEPAGQMLDPSAPGGPAPEARERLDGQAHAVLPASLIRGSISE